jgi:hypothetical protein
MFNNLNEKTQSQNTTTINFSELSKSELDLYIQENLPSLSGIKATKEKTIQMIELFNLQKKQVSDLSAELASVAKKTRSQKSKKSDQNIAKWIGLLSAKLDKSIDISVDGFNGSKIRKVQFLINKSDVQFGFSINQLTRYALTDFAKSYSSVGSHLLSFGCVQTIAPYGSYTKYNKDDKENSAYDDNQFLVELEFFPSTELYFKNAFCKKNGSRSKIDDKFHATDELLELVQSNFDKKATEILRLVLESKTQSQK